MMNARREVEVIKRVLEEEHLKTTEIFLGNDAIPYQIIEEIDMQLDTLYELIEPALRSTPSENVLMLDRALASNIKESIVYTSRDYSRYDVIKSITIDKDLLFDTLDDLLVAQTKEERINDLKEDIILYITKETKKDS